MTSKSKYGEDFGRYWPQDKAGNLINDTSWQKVSSTTQEIANTLTSFLQLNFSKDISAIYLRGSAAWGNEVLGLSDLDFFVVTKLPDFRWETPDSLAAFLPELIHQYKVEIECPFASEPPANKNWMEWRPFLAAQIKCFSLLLAGENLAVELPEFQPGKFLMPNLRWYREDWRDFKKTKAEASTIQAMTKLSLRCAYEMVMERKGVYTNSLGHCLDGFLDYYPRWSEAGEAVLATYLNPSLYEAKREKLIEFWEWLAIEIPGD